jgi:hypothetical protein
MAFNITTWSRKGRDYGRGAPPPRGSIEYAGVGDMFMPTPPTARAPQTAQGAARRPPPQAAPARPAPAAPAAPVAPATRRTSVTPWYLALGGAAYLGITYLLHRQPRKTTVAVPDACTEVEED